jgi:hypothetical protein
MALQSKEDELLLAWKAFDSDNTKEGWQTIPLTSNGPCRLFAARHFPGNEEGLLIGFKSFINFKSEQLPQGKGFLVSKADLGNGNSGELWIALTRQIGGKLDLFRHMATDILTTLDSLSGASDEKVFSMFLFRIRAWQDFMEKDRNLVLSSEAEIGLFGELEFLRDLIESGVSPRYAVECWEGPLNGIHDFNFIGGAVEVKSTTSLNNFIASIGSLDQLDPTIKFPLYLAGVRLEKSEAGRNVSSQVSDLRSLIKEDVEALFALNTKVVQAGFLDSSAAMYSKRFIRREIFLIEISGSFPYLSRANVAHGILNARYEIDLDVIEQTKLPTNYVLEQLGVTE